MVVMFMVIHAAKSLVRAMVMHAVKSLVPPKANKPLEQSRKSPQLVKSPASSSTLRNHGLGQVLG